MVRTARVVGATECASIVGWTPSWCCNSLIGGGGFDVVAAMVAADVVTPVQDVVVTASTALVVRRTKWSSS